MDSKCYCFCRDLSVHSLQWCGLYMNETILCSFPQNQNHFLMPYNNNNRYNVLHSTISRDSRLFKIEFRIRFSIFSFVVWEILQQIRTFFVLSRVKFVILYINNEQRKKINLGFTVIAFSLIVSISPISPFSRTHRKSLIQIRSQRGMRMVFGELNFVCGHCW